MHWNLAAECISLVFLYIIWSYSRRGNPLPSLKNRTFQACFLTTFCAMLSNILSTAMLNWADYVPTALTWVVTTIYFIGTPLMGMTYYFYTIATLYERRDGAPRVMAWSSLPGIAYLLLVLVNPVSRWLFTIDSQGVYTQGPLIAVTYIIFYVYCFGALLMSILHRKWLEPTIRRILTAFPVVAALVIVVQQVFPDVILSGSAATSALLLIYLYIQNKQISIDYLTSLPNRQEFLKMIDLKIRKGADASFTVVVMSLCDFKQINDTYGQHSGDTMLRAIAAYLHTMADSRFLYRFGGDEFAVLVEEGKDDRKSIEDLIGRLEERMASPWKAGKELDCILRYAIGVVRYPDSADSVEGLVGGIEYAVSRAKAGRAQADFPTVCYCGQEMLGEIRRRAQVADILRDSLSTGSFEVYYQPILDVRTGEYVFAESLLRLPHTPLGPLYPSEFIPVAEETGLIVPLTYQVLDRVCRLASRLAQEQTAARTLHVNFSAAQFIQEGLAERVSAILKRNGTPPSAISIEITESVLAENPQAVAEFAGTMHRRGVLMELDDFGTGYSNIISVMNTPLDAVKLDKSMIWSAMESEKSAVMVRSVTRIFQEMGMKVLAEGVETDEQDRFVRECGVDLIQGFLYARPMTEEDVLAFLARTSRVMYRG